MSAGIADFRLDDTTAASNVLREAMAAHDVAAANWHLQRDLGGIVPAAHDDGDQEVKYRAATPDGARALYAWQRARAELDAAMRVRRRELEGRL